MAKKDVLKELYTTWLDLLWAHHDGQINVEEMADMLKHGKAHVRRCKKSINKCREHYKAVHGKYPTMMGREPADPFAEKKA